MANEKCNRIGVAGYPGKRYGKSGLLSNGVGFGNKHLNYVKYRLSAPEVGPYPFTRSSPSLKAALS